MELTLLYMFYLRKQEIRIQIPINGIRIVEPTTSINIANSVPISNTLYWNTQASIAPTIAPVNITLLLK